MLLKRFPGRTLEELDKMDYGRLMRAWHAERISQAEQVGKQFLNQEITEMPVQVVQQIKRNDECLDSWAAAIE